MGLKNLSRAHGPCPFTEVPYRSFLQICRYIQAPVYAPQIAHSLFFLQQLSSPSLSAIRRESSPSLSLKPTFLFSTPFMTNGGGGKSVWSDVLLPPLQGNHNNRQHIKSVGYSVLNNYPFGTHSGQFKYIFRKKRFFRKDTVLLKTHPIPISKLSENIPV